ncbi:hypothetical protein HNQ71_001667 [Mesorhizobium sangaii]|uniref:Uncharacterized protein n=1 Tax=Mesorhizobium sangaii TaxID=505389 RepID=A0A841P6P2_9HYPH|nr:hypothetical protein [Mesorhizobium sangaii]
MHDFCAASTEVVRVRYHTTCDAPHGGDRLGRLDSLPHNGAVVMLLAVCGTTHKESYLDIVMVGVVGYLVAVVAFGSF